MEQIRLISSLLSLMTLMVAAPAAGQPASGPPPTEPRPAGENTRLVLRAGAFVGGQNIADNGVEYKCVERESDGECTEYGFVQWQEDLGWSVVGGLNAFVGVRLGDPEALIRYELGYAPMLGGSAQGLTTRHFLALRVATDWFSVEGGLGGGFLGIGRGEALKGLSAFLEVQVSVKNGWYLGIPIYMDFPGETNLGIATAGVSFGRNFY